MPATSPGARDESTLEIDLKDPRLAAFLAWLIPGAGHLYQGRTGKGVLFFVCILGTFFYGLYIGSGHVVYASTADIFSRPFLDRWQYICQVGVGLPALPALVQRERIRSHKAPIISDNFMRPPYDFNYPPPDRVKYLTSKDQTDPNHTVEHADELAKWNYDYGEYFDIGTMFTVIAGLLNVLVIFDAYGGPLIIVPTEEQKAQT
ncbi:MAG: hypothetical protein IT427_15050 [Pirellulales bacterium]|jgi:hypothetical protein|nr:hypothetical protein [Pirellulales bacterium]